MRKLEQLRDSPNYIREKFCANTNLRRAMWTEQFNGWCLTQTVVVAEVFFVLYSRLVVDKVWSMGINCLIER